jgi:L-lactate dehydrogenase complex protein LldG
MTPPLPSTAPDLPDANEQDFIMTLQKALGKPAGPVQEAPPGLFDTRPADHENRLAACLNKSKAERSRLLELFIAQAQLVNMQVFPVEDIVQAGLGIQKLIRKTTPEWGTQKSVTAWHHPLIDQLNLAQVLAPDDVTLYTTDSPALPDETLRRELRCHLIQSYMGITSADFCVAGTATLVMRTRPDQPRAVSLVPAIHVAVITLDQIIETLEELYFRLNWDPKEQATGLTNCMTFISGPSKTGDIELVMVHGAHGPRQLIVYVITDPALALSV